MPPDASKPEENQAAGLKLVDPAAAAESSRLDPVSALGGGPVGKRQDRAGLPLWLFVVALMLFFLVIGWQAQIESRLEAEVAGLEVELEQSQILLDAHRTHLTQIRGDVHDLSERIQGLRGLVDRNPSDVTTGTAEAIPENRVPNP